MPTILCLASYFKGNAFLTAAKAVGCRVYLLTVEKIQDEPWAREACDDIFVVPNFTNIRSLINTVAYLMRNIKFDLIVALDDFDVEVGAALREHFRMTNHGLNASNARYFRDKLAMRQRAAECHIPIPRFTGIFHHPDVTEFLAQVPTPWLIKPRSEASAAGIKVFHNSDELWQRIHELGDQQSDFLIEEMIPGELFHVDSLVVNNEVIFSEVNHYLRPLLDVYQGGGIYATRTMPRDHPDVAALKKINEQVLKGFGLQQGASHSEFMKAHHDGQCYFIETSARVGGAHTAELVEQATGINLWREWAQLEIARWTDSDYQLPDSKNRYAGVVISLARSESPDTSAFNDPEICHRVQMKNHIGFILSAEQPDRILDLLHEYSDRIVRDHLAILPGAESVAQ